MKTKKELLKMLFERLAELESKTASGSIKKQLEIELSLLYDILGEDIDEEYWERIELLI